LRAHRAIWIVSVLGKLRVGSPATQHFKNRLELEPWLRLSTPEIECWLLAAALDAHPAESMPFEDLLHLPELFPFEIGLTAHHARTCALLSVDRQGGGWDLVGVRSG
jgi:hypothetical protein